MEDTGLDWRVVFLVVVGIEAAERVFELWLARRNSKLTLARGGVESGRWQHRVVVAVHVAWLISCVLEVWLCDRSTVVWLAVTCAALLVAAMALRLWAMATLGDRWNLRVIAVPGEAPEAVGPYRWLRHPNYAALYVELFALPLLGGAWITACLIAPAHGIAVWLKSRAEDRALGRTAV